MNKKFISLLITGAMLVSSIIPVSAKSLTMMHDANSISLIGSINVYNSNPRIVSAVGLDVGNKEYVYAIAGNDTANKNQALVIYDITDPENVSVVETYTNIIGKTYNSQIAIKDNYLFVTNNLKLEYYTIGADGKLSGSATQVVTTNGNWCTIKIVDDYLFFAEAGTTDKCMRVYDVSDITSGVTLLGTTQAGFGVFNVEVEKISDTLYRTYYNWRSDLTQNGQKYGANGFGFAISDMTVNPNGTVTFTDRFKNNTGFENISDWWSTKDISLIGENKVYLVSWYQNGTSKTQFVIDASNPESPTVTEIDTVRAISVTDIDENYYIVGDHSLFKIRKKSDNSVVKSVSTSAGESYEMTKYNGKLLVSGNGKLVIVDLYSELKVEMSNIPEINDGILNITASVKLNDGDALVLDVFGEETDVTSEINNGTLSYSKNISVADGNYTAKLSIKRNGSEILSEQKNFTVRKTMPVVITNSGLTNGTTAITGTVTNTHNTATSTGKIYAAVYNSNGSLVKAYPYDFSALSKNVAQDYSITLDAAIEDGQIVKLFAVDNNGKVLSEVTKTGDQTFNAENTNIPAKIDEKVALFAEVTPDTIITKISGKSAEEKEIDVLVEVYKPAPNDAELDYINVFKTNADGSFYCEYPLTNGVEGQSYTLKAHTTGDSVLSGTRDVSYYSNTTINLALTAMQGADKDTFESVAILDTATYKNVYALNTEIYSLLEPEYKLAVADAISGVLYDSIAALNTAFNNKVAEQKALMDNNNAIKAALLAINTATKDTMELALQNATPVLGLTYGSLYSELNPTMKENLYQDWLCDKGFTLAADVNTAIKEGTAVEYMKLAQYTAVVNNSIIETYKTELGLNETDVSKYTSYTDGKYTIISNFLKKGSQTYADISTDFASAVSEYVPPSGGDIGGNNSSVSVRIPSGTGVGEIKPVNPDEVISDDVIRFEKNNNFTDVGFDDWYFEAVCALAEKKVVEGITDTEYKPNQNVKREEFIKMLISCYDNVDYSAEAPFTDTQKNRWYYSYVATAYQIGLVNGISDSKFGVGLDITREDLAKMVYNAMKTMGTEFSGEVTTADYVDMSSVSDYAIEGVNALSSLGILAGFEDNTFRPKEKVTRAMAAQVIYRVLNNK